MPLIETLEERKRRISPEPVGENQVLTTPSVPTSNGRVMDTPAGVIPLGDRKAMQKVAVPADVMAEIIGTVGTTPEQKASFRGQQRIGFWEAFFRSDGFHDLKNIGREAVSLFTLSDPPEITIEDSARSSIEMLGVADRWTTQNYDLDTLDGRDKKARDIEVINFGLNRLAEEHARGFDTIGEIGKGSADMTIFLLEMAATGPFAKLGREGAKRVLSTKAKNFVKTKIGKALYKTIPTASGAVIRTGILAPVEAPEIIAERRLDAKFDFTEKGYELAKDVGETPFTSVYKGLGGLFIELYTEELGVIFNPIAGALGRGIVKGTSFLSKPFAETLKKVYFRLHPKGVLKDLTDAVKFDSLIGEMGEERLGDIARGVFDIDDRRAENPYTMVDRIYRAMPNWHELKVEAGIIGLTGGTLRGTAGAIDFIQKQKAKINFKEAEEGVTISDEVLDEIFGEDVEETKDARTKPSVKEPVTKEPPTEKAESKIEVVPEKVRKEPVSRTEIQEFEIGGRIRQLEQEKKPFEIKKDNLEKERQGLLGEGKSINAIEKRIAANNKNLQRLEGEIGKLNLGLLPIVEKRKKIQTTPTKIGKLLKRTKKLTQAEVKQAQTDLVTFLKDSLLPADQFKRFLTTVKNIQTQEQLAEALPDIEKNIKIQVEKAEQKAQIGKIKKLLKRIKPKKTGKKPVGKFTAPIQKALDTISAATKLNFFEAESRKTDLLINIQKRPDPTPTTQEFFELTVLQTASDLSNRSSIELGSLRKRLQDLVDKGRIDAFTKRQNLKEKTEREVEAVVKTLGTADPTATLRNQNIKRFYRNLLTGGKSINGWEDLTDALSQDLPAPKVALKRLEKKAKRELKGSEIQESKDVLSFMVKSSSLEPLARINLSKTIANVENTEQLRGAIDKVRAAIKGLGKEFANVAFESPLSKILRVREVEQLEKGNVDRSALRFRDSLIKAFGFTKEKQANRQISLDSKRVDLGLFEDASGQTIRLELSKSEVRKMWMELQDPDLREVIEAEEGGYTIGSVDINGLTQDMQDRIFKESELKLSVEDKAFAKEQMGFYKELYKKVNEKYRDKFGVDLPFNEFYSPISRDVDGKDIADSFLEEMNFRRSDIPGFLKSRVKNFQKIKIQSDIAVMQRHIIEMEHFLVWTDKLKQINDILGDRRVSSRIKALYGEDAFKIMNFYAERFRSGASRRIELAERVPGFLRRNFTLSVLALKPALTIKQLMSIPAFAEFIPVTAFTVGVAEALNPFAMQKQIKILMESDLFRTRGTNLSRDVQAILNSSEFAIFKKNPQLLSKLGMQKLMLLTTKMGDAGAIYVGGWAVYSHTLKETGSHEKALAKFDEATAATQQSSDISQLSQLQQLNEWTRLFTMFTSAQNQYLRRELGAIRNVAKGRIPPSEFAKKIAIYHLILPFIWQVVSDFGEWDEEEVLRALMLGPLNGYFLLGDVLDWGIRQSLNAFADFELAEFKPQAIPLESTYNGVDKFFNTIDQEVMLTEDWIQAAKDLSAPVGQLTGQPIKRILDLYEGAVDILEKDEIEAGLLKLGGWSPYRVNNLLEKRGLKEPGESFEQLKEAVFGDE